MTPFYKIVDGGYIAGFGTNGNDSATEITEAEYINLLSLIRSAPSAPDGFQYKLRADNLEWELVKLPPIDPEPLTDEEALTRYANELTGASDPDLISAAETLIDKYSESKDKAEAYDILIGGAS